MKTITDTNITVDLINKKIIISKDDVVDINDKNIKDVISCIDYNIKIYQCGLEEYENKISSTINENDKIVFMRFIDVIKTDIEFLKNINTETLINKIFENK